MSDTYKVKDIGTAQEGTHILKVTCDICGSIIKVTGMPSKIPDAVKRHRHYTSPKV